MIKKNFALNILRVNTLNVFSLQSVIINLKDYFRVAKNVDYNYRV